jgi:hypothetical protein
MRGTISSLVDDVVVRGRGLVAPVLELVGMSDHLAQEGRERAKLHVLPSRGEVDGFVHEGAHERQVRFSAAPAELAEHGFEARLVLLLQVV